MLSLEQAYEQQGAYQASPDERAKIAGVTMLAFVGGVSVGKNYLMHESGFFITGTETSRHPRRGDNLGKYTYVSNEVMLESIERGQYIQYGVHLPDLIYATRASHYQLDAVNTKDIWFDAIEPLNNKGFKSVKTVSVLVPSEQWLDYLTDRFYDRTVEYAQDRLTEADRSIHWSLEQHLSRNPDHLLIINDDAQTAGNLDRIRAFAIGEPVELLSDELVKNTTDQMFTIIKNYHNNRSS